MSGGAVRWFAHAPGPRIGLDGEGTLHHPRQLGGCVGEQGPLQQIGYLQYLQLHRAMCRAKRTQEARMRQIQDDGQAAAHEEAEVLGIKLRSGSLFLSKHVWIFPTQAHPLAHGQCVPYYHPRPYLSAISLPQQYTRGPLSTTPWPRLMPLLQHQTPRASAARTIHKDSRLYC